MFVGWFRPSPSASWRAVCRAESLHECTRRLIQATRGEGWGSGTQRFVTKGQSPDAFFDSLDSGRKERVA